MIFLFSKKTLDILYVHNTEDLFGDPFLNEMNACGVISILNTLKDNGFSIGGLSSYYSKYIKPRADIVKEIKEINVSLFYLVDIWSYNGLYKKVQTLKKLKQINPEVPIVVGGQLSSIFYKDVIDLPEVDYLIRGDGEESALMLAKAFKDKSVDLNDIPGLVYKRNEEVIENSNIYFFTQEEFNKKNYINFEIIKDYKKYFIKLVRETMMVFPVLIHKGCYRICERCNNYGKPKSTNMFISRKHGQIFRNVDKIKDDIERISDAGINGIIITTLGLPNDAYRQEFLQKIKYLDMKVVGQCEDPVPEDFEFIDKLYYNFRKDSMLLFEGLGATEALLKKSGIRLNTEEMHKWLRELKWTKVVTLEVYSPSTTLEDIDSMIELIEMYKKDLSVAFMPNVGAARCYPDMNFSGYLQLSKDFNHDDFVPEGQKKVIAKFHDELSRRKLKHKIIKA